jgi:ubiquinone/menaquinone biosynthesis C-methylase UbiE
MGSPCATDLPATAVLRPGGLELTDLALGLCSLPPGARMLDVGCGTGAAMRHVRQQYGYDAVGIDPAAAWAQCMKGRAESLPLEDASFDCVLCECVLSIVADAEQALREMHRVLTTGGYAIISDIYDKSRPHELRELLSLCDFTVQVFQDHSRSLREYAAAAALRGESCAQALPGTLRPEQAGYCLIIARKD